MNLINQIFGTPLGWIAHLLFLLVRNYGLVLILFTVVVRVLLFPLAIKQQKSMARMQLMQPKLQELQKKYAKNKDKYQREMAKLYEEEHYNPMSGCLPMLIQFPILYGVIDVVYRPLTHILRIGQETIAKAGEILISISDTTAATNSYLQELDIIKAVQADPSRFSEIGQEFIDQITNFDMHFLGMDLGAVPGWNLTPLILLPIFSGIASFLSIYVSMKLNSAGQGNSQVTGMNRGMMLIMPIFSFFIAVNYPIGVGLYWTVGYVLSILQTLVMKKFYSPEKIAATVQAQMEAEREKRRTLKSVVIDEEGEEVVTEQKVSQKEADRRRLAEARKRMAEKYGEEYNDEDEKDEKQK